MEVATMRFVARNTNIPIPFAWTSFRWRSIEYIVMSRVPGVTLEDMLKNSKDGTIENQEAIIDKLRHFVAQLRSLKSPHGPLICSVLGGPIDDYRVCHFPSGPYDDEQHMNLQLRCAHPVDRLPDFVISSHAISHPIVFTHGEIDPRNILVQGSRVTLMDWETAGWFPAHWEYCKAI
jgi:aminoglycoside phosphotransferase (APT) family kinase protein